MLAKEQLIQGAKFKVTMSGDNNAPKTYMVKIRYENDAQVLAEAVKATVVTIQRRIRGGEIELPLGREVLVNIKGEPELTEEERDAKLVKDVDPARLLRALLVKKGITVPSGMSEIEMYALLVKGAPTNGNALEEIPTESSAVPQDEPTVTEDEGEESETSEEDDLDARIEKMVKWPLKQLRAKCEELEITHEKLSREDMAVAIAMAE